MNCPNCGSVQVQKDKCEHCGSTTVLGNCRVCLTELPLRAKFCPGCGTPTEISLNPDGVGPSCPDCQTTTQQEMQGNVVTYRCLKCQGLWIPKEQWEVLEKQSLKHPGHAPTPRKEVCDHPYRKCPVCNQMLNRRTPAPRMPTLDICWKDGFWLDAGELEPTIAAMRANAADPLIQPKQDPENISPELLRHRLRKQNRKGLFEHPEEYEARALLSKIFGDWVKIDFR